MKKEKVDQIITEYLQRIYGFAIKKSFSYDEAEELSSDMVFEVYRSLLSSDGVINLEGYIWRICQHAYAKYVSAKKRMEGISKDEIDIPYYDEPFLEDAENETNKLIREIAFLSHTRRKIVYMFYYKNQSIQAISTDLNIPEGTVKWHLNKARNELKEGLSMERKIGTLGLSPIEATGYSHGGSVGKNGGPEFYLNDKLNLNIVYSVYHSPRTKAEIAEELGVSPVYIEDKINFLEDNGYIVKIKGNKYTTYVDFTPETYSLELEEKETLAKLHIAEILAKEYVPQIRKAVEDILDVYIPGKNRELFEAAVVLYSLMHKCLLPIKTDLSKYEIKDTDGGCYFAHVYLDSKISDPDYVPELKDQPSYFACGSMNRWSQKYPAVGSWSVDTRYSSRKGGWANNLTSDYEFMYEWIKGDISENPSNAEKFARLRERNFILPDGKPGIMIVNLKGTIEKLQDKLPKLDSSIKDIIADTALEFAMARAKAYPPQMQDLIVNMESFNFAVNKTAIMVMDILYSNGTFKPLNEEEMITSNLLMFSDILPEE